MKWPLIFFYGLTLAAACLITNCPRGGKRGFVSYLGKMAVAKQGLKDIPPQCIKCGPGGDGRCVGPDICCGPRIGCLMASPGISPQCMGVNFNPSTSGPTCMMSTGLGVCTIDGICCDSESCRLESSCEAVPYSTLCPIDIAEDDRMHL